MSTGEKSAEQSGSCLHQGQTKRVLRTHLLHLYPKAFSAVQLPPTPHPSTESSLRKPSLMTPDYRGHVPTLCEQCSRRPAPQETLPGPHLCESTALDSWFKGQSILPKTQEPVWFDSPLCTYPLDTAHSRCSINVYLEDGACPFLPRVLHPSASVSLPLTSPMAASC